MVSSTFLPPALGALEPSLPADPSYFGEIGYCVDQIDQATPPAPEDFIVVGGDKVTSRWALLRRLMGESPWTNVPASDPMGPEGFASKVPQMILI